MMYYPPPFDVIRVPPDEQERRERKYKERIKLALERYEAWKRAQKGGVK